VQASRRIFGDRFVTAHAPDNLVSAAAINLANVYGEEACGEALVRALVNERTQRREDARFWVDVYARLFDAQPGMGSAAE
jgi:hypothetical protein